MAPKAEFAGGGSPRRFRLTIEYEGTRFSGWQRQRRGESVQGALERALRRMTGERIRVDGAGRTDAGVHALGQVAAFTTLSRIPADALRRGLNALLPAGASVRSVRRIPLAFNPRRDAIERIYRYEILNRPARSPLDRERAWHVSLPLDARAMGRAARALVGRHDFRSFTAGRGPEDRGSTVRTVTRLSVTRRGARISIVVGATGFLRCMVRRMVGTLVEVGRGRTPTGRVARILAARHPSASGATAPPHGLYLVGVRYPPLGRGGRTG